MLSKVTEENQSVPAAACVHCSIESVVGILVWYAGWTVAERKALQRVRESSAQAAFEDIYSTRCLRRASNIIKDSSHPCNHLFTLLPSRERYRPLIGHAPPDSWTVLPTCHQETEFYLKTRTVHYKLWAFAIIMFYFIYFSYWLYLILFYVLLSIFVCIHVFMWMYHWGEAQNFIAVVQWQ